MSDWLFDNFGWVVFAVLVVSVGGLYFAVKAESAENQRLVAQCMADGKKEYECVSLLTKPASQMVPIPIVIPSSR